MNRTRIEWVKNPDGSQGYTWNPITGCLNHVNGMCKGGNFPCYAYKLAHGRLKVRYLANSHITPYAGRWHADDDPFYPRFWQSRLNEPLYGNPKGIFVCDMGELFGDWLPDGWADEVFHTIKRSPQHRFYLLTKQPQNLVKFSPFPRNCYVGATVTRQQNYLDALAGLAKIEANKRFLSLEPLLEPIEVGDGIKYIDQIIIGTQTKPCKPPKAIWVREITEAAVKAGIAVFHKDNLGDIFDTDFPKRQEMPKV